MRWRRAGSSASARSASPSSTASPGRHEHAVQAVADDVAVAGDVGGHDRGARGERLGQHHAEALAAERRRAEQVGLARAGATSRPRSRGRPRSTPSGSSSSGSTSSAVAPATVRRASDAGAAQSLEGAQQHRQPLALLGAADEQDLERRSWGGRRSGGRRPGPRRWARSGSGRRRSGARSSARPRRRRSGRSASSRGGGRRSRSRRSPLASQLVE